VHVAPCSCPRAVAVSLAVLPASTLIELVASGDVSAADLVRLHLDRIERLNPQLNAFVQVRAEQALDEAARQDDAAARGVPRGPLGGLPVTVKSAIEVAGLRCESGSPTRQGRMAERDAVVVARLRQAGAIVLGTTNVAEMLMGYESENPVYGRTRNPWNLATTPGGSSGGEAAAIATGCSAGGIGSDGGGSIRVPAHFTGICGFKPTPGRWPATGHQPECLGPFSLIAAVGPMARTVADLQLFDDAASGWDAGDPMAVLTDGTRQKPAHLQAVFFEDDGVVPVTVDTRAAVRRAARAAADAGFTVEEFRPPALADAVAVWEEFFAETALVALHEEFDGAERKLPILRAYLQDSAIRDSASSAARLIDAWVARDRLRAAFQAQLGPHRVLVCPVAAVPAFGHGERAWEIGGRRVTYLEAMRYSQWFNALGAPAVVVPVGRSAGGLPVGVQVAGRPFDDALVLHVAAAIEQACGGYRPPPGLGEG